MSKRGMVGFILATIFVLAGISIFVGALAAGDWKIDSLSTVKYETNTHEVSDSFDNITINTDTADIILAPSDNEKCKVVCYEDEKAKHLVSVENGSLCIRIEDKREWMDHIGISVTDMPRITVYLPKTEYVSLFIEQSTGDVELPEEYTFQTIDISGSTGAVRCYADVSEKIWINRSTGSIDLKKMHAGEIQLSVSTGDVNISEVTCGGNVEIKVSTGDVKMTDVVCENFTSKGSTGYITMINLLVSEDIKINRSTGDVKFEECDAMNLSIWTDTGYVKGSLLSEKIFITQTDTGSVDVPKTTTGGTCEITTDTGDIKITVVE